jgi:predicted metal-dependent HD superfamily phosphohydrolase
MRKLQAAPALYRSAPLAAAFERQARRNIARALADVVASAGTAKAKPRQ